MQYFEILLLRAISRISDFYLSTSEKAFSGIDQYTRLIKFFIWLIGFIFIWAFLPIIALKISPHEITESLAVYFRVIALVLIAPYMFIFSSKYSNTD